jgi:hypothetical protein
MADENISDVQRKLTAAMQQQAEDYARYGQMQVSTADQLRDAQFQAATGMKNFTKAGGMAGQALGALAAAGVAATAAMYEGKKGQAAFNSSLDEISTAVTLAAGAIALLVGGPIGALVIGFGMAAKAAIAYTKAANDMSDKLYKSYSGLAKSGAAASDGMTGVFRDAKKLGLSMNELDSFTSLIAENSQDLALFAGTVYDGRKKFADMSEAMEGSRVEFFKMGITQTEINEGMAGYLRTVTRTGRAQTMTTDQLASSARNYITEQDALAKLTGMSAKKQQDALDKALQNEQFLAKIRQLEADGEYGKADELKKLNAYYQAIGDEAAEGFQATVNGNLRNKAAQKLNFSTQGEALRSTQDVLSGQLKAAGAADRVYGAFAEGEKGIARQQAQFGIASETGIKYSETVNAATLATGQKRVALDKKILEEQEAQKKGADAITAGQAKTLKTEQDINKKLEQDVLKGIPNAQAATAKLANATDTLADGFTHLSDALNGIVGFFGGKKDPAVVKAKEEAAQKAVDMPSAGTPEETSAPPGMEFDAEGNVISSPTAPPPKPAPKPAPAPPPKPAPKPAAAAPAPPPPPAPKPAAAAPAPAPPPAPKPAAAPAPAAAGAAKSSAKSSSAKSSGGQQSYTVPGGAAAMAAGFDKEFAAAEAEMGPVTSAGAKVAAANAELDKYTKITGAKSKSLGALAENITKFESGKAGYNAYNRGTVGNKMIGSDKPIDFSKMTIAEYLKHGKLKSGDPDKIFAVGKYQIIPGTMEGLVKKLKLDPEKTYLDQVTQDLLFNEGLIKQSRPNVAAYLQGKSNDRDLAILDMAKEFASVGVPYPAGKAISRGESYYAGIGGNKAHNSPDAVGAALDADRKSLVSAAEGGLFSGPNSGYPATLHGDEAVVPLNNSNGNFVQLFEQMAMMMGQQASSLDELVRIAKNGNDISTKILHSAS